MKKIWEILEKSIQDKYGIIMPEWVQVTVSRRGKIHITVVSDQKIFRQDIQELVNQEIKVYSDRYQTGFINIYSVAQAEELRLEKIRKKSGHASWADALQEHEGGEEEQEAGSKIISFYSYKGGVGRTVALIQTAYNLAAAGKRVLLLDLDIEAPSLHNIFREQVTDPYSGIQYGIVEYLYRTVVEYKENEALDGIFCQIPMENIAGELFLIPAVKEIDKNYIYQIDRLQTQMVQERNIFEKIFEYVSHALNLDLIMIDTRAGFNPWGALSLLSLSDQVIFLAYPNQENIEGLNAAFQMVHNTGKKKSAIVMSKVVATDEGRQKAEKLFAELETMQKEMLPIYYKQEMALSSYPIRTEGIQNPYSILSDYIVDSEKAADNRILLKNGKKEELLKEVFQPVKQLIKLEDVQKFKNEKAYLLLKYHFQEELYGLNSQFSTIFVRIQDMIVPVPLFTLVPKELDENYCSWITSESSDYRRIGLELILPMLRGSSLKNNFMQEIPDVDAQTFQISDLLKALAYEVPINEIWSQGILKQQDGRDTYPVTAELQVVINISSKILQNHTEQVIKNIKGLTSLYNKGTGKIQFKFLVEAAVWDQYPELAAALKGNILEVNVSKNDIFRFLTANLSSKTFKHAAAREYYQEKVEWDEENMLELLELVIGIRKYTEVYSSTVLSYLYESLHQVSGFRYDQLLDCLKEAAQQELKNPNKTYADRLIGFDKIQTIVLKKIQYFSKTPCNPTYYHI